MLSEKQIKFYENVVHRLIMQYKEYLQLSSFIRDIEHERFMYFAKVSKEQGMHMTEVMKDPVYEKKMKYFEQKIALYKTDLKRLSDEMSFANHYIWMMYKDRAYKGTSSEIATMGDFRRHCKPEEYVCTQRYQFLLSYVKNKKGIDIHDVYLYPDHMKLEEFYQKEEMMSLLDDVEFLTQWKQNEYMISENVIHKWNVSAKK